MTKEQAAARLSVTFAPSHVAGYLSNHDVSNMTGDEVVKDFINYINDMPPIVDGIGED